MVGAAGGARRTVLVTGASGVLGSAIVDALSDHEVIRLGHQGSEVGGPREVQGNVAESRLGLPAGEYAELLRVDCVVHCAAISHYAAREADVEAVNVGGTRNVLALCAEANAHLYHVGTAFQGKLDTEESEDSEESEPSRPQSPFSREPYLRSKRRAEAAVRASGVSATALRPSLVIGAQDTGAVPQFQGIHTLVRFLLTETYGVVPALEHDLADFLPRDTMAAAIACLVADGATPPEFWLTAGDAALTMQQVVDVVLAYGREVGLDPPMPRFMDPEVIDRLVRPALIPELPHRERQRFEYVIEFASALHSGRVFPSSLADCGHRLTPPTTSDLEEALLNSLRFWGSETGIPAESRRATTPT